MTNTKKTTDFTRMVYTNQKETIWDIYRTTVAINLRDVDRIELFYDDDTKIFN